MVGCKGSVTWEYAIPSNASVRLAHGRNENPHMWFVLPDGERARERVDGRQVRRIVVRGESAEVLRVKKPPSLVNGRKELSH